MTADLLIALGAVFVAEMGDKTQLVVLMVAGRHRPLRLLAALASTIVVLQALSVSLGTVAGSVVPDDVIGLVVGAMFLGFGWWSWRVGRHGAGSSCGHRPGRARRGSRRWWVWPLL